MEIKLITPQNDLYAICKQLAPDLWGEDNDMAEYTPENLKRFISSEQNICAIGVDGGQIVCCALGYILDHPDNTRSSIYLDELDTHPDYRRKGYASQMINWLRNFAEVRHLKEVWLGTESEDNLIANTFYTSQNPTEVLPCNIYSYSASKTKISS